MNDRDHLRRDPSTYPGAQASIPDGLRDDLRDDLHGDLHGRRSPTRARRNAWGLARAGAAVAATTLLFACSSIPVTVEVVDAGSNFGRAFESAVTHRRLSLHTQRRLSRHGLEQDAIQGPPGVLLETVGDALRASAAWPDRLALAELYYLEARSREGDDAARYLLEAALDAGHALFAADGPDRYDTRAQVLLGIYDVAIGDLFAHYQNTRGHPRSWGRLAGLDRDYPLTVTSDWSEGFFERFRLADSLEFRGTGPRHRAYGVGTPLVGLTLSFQEQAEVHSYYPRTGMVVPVTAVLARARQGDGLELRLEDPLAKPTLEVADQVLPLAADFSVAVACFVAGLDPSTYGNAGFFSPGNEKLPQGIRVLQPYDPNKIPVVFVHGLWSSPIIWRFAANAILGDPELRQRYQVWIYLYPTGAPILTNSAVFRGELEEARRHFDPEGDDPATQDIVLVGHSMGGLLSSTAIRSSGDEFADRVTTVPRDEYTERIRNDPLLGEILFFEPKPYIRRAIFMSTPHGGSSMSDSLVGTIGRWLISPSAKHERMLEEIRERHGDILDPEIDHVGTSVEELSTTNPVLHVLRSLPIADHVRYHSIIGQEEEGPREEGSDGVVPYESSHLDGAESELVVRSDHSTELRAAAIAEVCRILREHLHTPPKASR